MDYWIQQGGTHSGLERRRGLLAECSRTKTAAENIHFGDIFTISKKTYQKTNEQTNKTKNPNQIKKTPQVSIGVFFLARNE